MSRVSHEVESCNNSTHGGAKDSSQEEHGKHRESQQPSERRTVSGNAISGSSWGGMPVRHACRAHGGEEGWTNEGAAFLQVPPQSVRVFPLGSERDRRVEEPRSHDECNRDTEHEREAGESTREAEGEGGNASCDAGKNVAGGTTNDGDGSDSSRCPSLGDPAGEREQAHLSQVEYLQNQLMWMTTVAGEERVQQAMTDPTVHQETVARAMEMRRQLEQQNMSA